jgi:hypothetical protein
MKGQRILCMCGPIPPDLLIRNLHIKHQLVARHCLEVNLNLISNMAKQANQTLQALPSTCQQAATMGHIWISTKYRLAVSQYQQSPIAGVVLWLGLQIHHVANPEQSSILQDLPADKAISNLEQLAMQRDTVAQPSNKTNIAVLVTRNSTLPGVKVVRLTVIPLVIMVKRDAAVPTVPNRVVQARQLDHIPSGPHMRANDPTRTKGSIQPTSMLDKIP